MIKHIIERDTECMICSHIFPLVALIRTGVTICSNCAINAASQIVEQQYKDITEEQVICASFHAG